MSDDLTSPTRAPSRRWGALLLRLGVSVGLCVLAFRKADLREIVSVLAQARPVPLALAYVAWLTAAILAATRWFLLVRHGAGPPVRLGSIVGDAFVCAFVGLALPTQVGGDLMRIAALIRRGLKAGEASSSVLMDRVLGMAAVLLLCLCGLVWGTALHSPGVVRAAVGAVGLGAVVFVAVLFMPAVIRPAERALSLLKLHRLRDGLSSAYHTCRSYLLAPRLLGAALALSLLLQSLAVLATWLAARALNIPVSVGAAFTIFPAIFVLTMIAPTINGIGVRDNLFVWGLAAVGTTRNAALALAAVNLLATFAVALPGCIGLLRLGLGGLRGPGAPEVPSPRAAETPPDD